MNLDAVSSKDMRVYFFYVRWLKFRREYDSSCLVAATASAVLLVRLFVLSILVSGVGRSSSSHSLRQLEMWAGGAARRAAAAAHLSDRCLEYFSDIPPDGVEVTSGYLSSAHPLLSCPRVTFNLHNRGALKPNHREIAAKHFNKI